MAECCVHGHIVAGAIVRNLTDQKRRSIYCYISPKGADCPPMSTILQSNSQGADPSARQLQLGLDSPGHLADSTIGAARHLLARRSILDDTVSRTPATGATMLLRSPPTPA